MKRLTLRKGTVIHVGALAGIDVTLVEDTVVTVNTLGEYHALRDEVDAQPAAADEKDSDR